MQLPPTRRTVSLAFAAFVAAGVLTACGGDRANNNSTADSAGGALNDSASGMSAGAGGAMSAPAVPIAEQKRVLDELGTLGGKPIETLDAAEARKQPSPTDAVMSLLKKEGKPTTPEPVGSVVNRTIPGPGGNIPVRIYTPAGNGPFPVIVYYHGGGWVIATMDTYDASARGLTNAANAVLISVEYRKGPENKFPAAHDDAYAAYTWALANAASIKGDPAHVAVAGESAGGGLAVATAMTARDKGAKLPVHILAVYPIAGIDTNTASYRENATAKPLNRPMMSWFFNQYAPEASQRQDPRINLVAADLKGLPATTIVLAQIDPLRSDGEMLASRLRDAGVSVELKQYDGVAHEFFGQGAAVPVAKTAVAFAANGLKQGFSK